MGLRTVVDRVARRARPFNLSDQRSRTWDERAAAAARLLASAAEPSRQRPLRVADVGCGNQRLRAHLEAVLGAGGLTYQGFDLRPQADDVVALDLNETVPGGEWDAVCTLGVLEYLDDMDGVLERLASVAPWFVASHVVADSGAYTSADALRLGWKRLPTAAWCTAALTQAGFEVVEHELMDGGRSGLWLSRPVRDG